MSIVWHQIRTPPTPRHETARPLTSCYAACSMSDARKGSDGVVWAVLIGLAAALSGTVLMEYLSQRRASTAACPVCHGAVPVNAPRCPHCRTGLTWKRAA
jgi:hypothetical protein